MNIRDIAKMAKVSVSTVSKIINNKDDDISEETRKRVLKIVKECQYVPYSKVRESSPKKTNIIGILFSNSIKESNELLHYIERYSAENGYSTIVSYIDENESNIKKSISILLAKNIEGIIIYLRNKDLYEVAENVIGSDIPYIFLQNNKNINVPSVCYSKEQTGFLATECLIKAGHSKIGCILTKDEEELQEGYIRALYENEIILEKDKIFIANETIEAAQLGIRKLINTDITAILCGDSKIACIIYNFLKDRGINIPQNISIVSANDSIISELLIPTLTGIEIPIKKIGQESIKMLVDLIENKNNKIKEIKEIDLCIKDRNSIDKPYSKSKLKGRKIIVVGSMNMDITIKVPSIPTDGETILSRGVDLIPGGKGANQAIGAGKLGGAVYAIGRLGSDNDGKIIYENLIKNSVKTEGIVFDTKSSTGKAYINVAKNGESSIVVYAGANSNFDKNQIKKFKHLFREADFCLLSMEISLETVLYTIYMCKENNVKVILKPSTVKNIDEEVLSNIDYMIPNEKEIDILVPNIKGIEEKAKYFYEKGVKNVIVTLGSKGCYLKNEKYDIYVPSAEFIPIDTTGAADAFISALSVYLSEGSDILSAIGFATYNAGISITRSGVQPALPDRFTLELYKDEINNLINNIKSKEV